MGRVGKLVKISCFPIILILFNNSIVRAYGDALPVADARREAGDEGELLHAAALQGLLPQRHLQPPPPDRQPSPPQGPSHRGPPPQTQLLPLHRPKRRQPVPQASHRPPHPQPRRGQLQQLRLDRNHSAHAALLRQQGHGAGAILPQVKLHLYLLILCRIFLSLTRRVQCNMKHHSVPGISFLTLMTLRSVPCSQQNTLDLMKLVMGRGRGSTAALRKSGDPSLSLWHRFLNMVMYLAFFSLRAYSLLEIVYCLQLSCSSPPSSSLSESTPELSRSGSSPQSSKAGLICEQALQRTWAISEKQRLHSSSPSAMLPLLSSRSTKTLATTCLSAEVAQESAVLRMLCHRCCVCSPSERLPARCTWKRQTREMERSFPTQGTDLAATIPLLERLARKVWMDSVRVHQACCERGEKRVQMAMRATYATCSIMLSSSSSQLKLSSSSLSRRMRVAEREGASSSTSSSRSTMRLTRMPSRQCILQSLLATPRRVQALEATRFSTPSLTALPSCLKTTIRRRKMSMVSATCHTYASPTASSKNCEPINRSGNSQQVRAVCTSVMILLFMSSECGMAAPQYPQADSLMASHTSTRITIATPSYSQWKRFRADPRWHCARITSMRNSLRQSAAFTLSGVEKSPSRKRKMAQKEESLTLLWMPSWLKNSAGRNLLWPMQLLRQSRACSAPTSSCRCCPLRSSSMVQLLVNCWTKVQQRWRSSR